MKQWAIYAGFFVIGYIAKHLIGWAKSRQSRKDSTKAAYHIDQVTYHIKQYRANKGK